ncbi:MAG: glutamyl-tRNA reductase [Campylobacterales bacterium]|nr:glutamyl-tRNA reductase [Campylobacterales bacterium]
MHYLTVSYTHKNTTLEIRERLAYSNDHEIIASLAALTAFASINEAFLVSTCNRMEIVCSCSDVERASDEIVSMLSKHSRLDKEELERRADIFDDEGAIHHLFSVASSLDSMVVGETQIAGQLKDAFRFATMHGYAGPKLARAVHYAFKCAAEVRNVTDISSGATSVASVAVAKAAQLLGSLKGRSALVIGAGDMSVISAKTLQRHGAQITIMNRTRAKAEALALTCNAKVRSYSELFHAINDYELLFTSTGSLEPIITNAMVQTVSFERYWFDMAVPRDIAVGKHEGLHLFVVDDLKTIVDENLSLREDEAREAFLIVGRHTVAFFEWLKTQSIEPLIKELYARAHDAAAAEAQRAVSAHYFPKNMQANVEKACEQSIKRFLHEMVVQMRRCVRDASSDTMIEALRQMLEVKDEDFITHKERT